MAINKKLYDKDSIQSLNPRDFCRLRPGVYCGNTEYATQLAQEVFANSLDEYCIGHGNLIKVNITKDIVEICDYGQGFLINQIRPEDGKTVFEASLSVMNTSGKYDNESGVYQGTSLGLNGMGSKLTNYLSNWMEAFTCRDGQYEKLYFEEGLFKKREVGKHPTNDSGTIIKWKPSSDFFTHTEVEINVLKKLFKVIACLNPGLTILLNDNGTETTYFSKNGLNDLVDEDTKNKEILKNRMSMSHQSGKNKIDLVMTYTNNYSPSFIAYVNNGETNSGPHITQIKTLLTREFNKFFRDKKWLKEKDENLSGDDIQEGMYLAFNITTQNVGYDAQIKSRVVKLDMTPFTSAIAEQLKYWLTANEKEVKAIADKALNARKAREAAQKAKDAVRNKIEKKKKAIKFDSKLADCYSKQRSKCEIYITEGK